MQRVAIHRVPALLVFGLCFWLARHSSAQPGTVWTWGGNANGQLGDGTTIGRTTPTRVPNLTSVQAITAGGSHSLALRSGGFVSAWGANALGQLGDGTHGEDSYLPNAVQGLEGVLGIAAGLAHSLAVRQDGSAWGWGDNEVGQLGDGTNAWTRDLPVRASGLERVTALVGGAHHSMALLTDGSVWAYGRNLYGQLGDGTNVERWTAVPTLGLSHAVALAGSHHSLALLADGTVWAWGRNVFGQLGDGTDVERWFPAPVPGLTGVVAIACGEWHSLALRSDGTVWTWGRNDHGQLGDGSRVDRWIPVQVLNLNHVIGIAAGANHSLAVGADGGARGWGGNFYGQVGDGTTEDRDFPVSVGDLDQARTVSAGQFHSMALEGDSVSAVVGVVTLGDLAGYAAGTSVACQIRVPGTMTVLETHAAVLGAGGYLLIPSTRTGRYDVAVKASHWLRAKVANVEIGASGAFGVDVSLVNGDVNGDNSVNIADFLALRVAFGATSVSVNWNSDADLDGDGTVDIADFLVLRKNFGRTGD